MHPILQDITKHMKEEIRQHLKDVTDDMLEEGGAVYYMNGKNGTEFDWHVNNRLSDLFIFYTDKENLGAAKAQVYRDGTMLVWTYEDHGHKPGSEQQIDLHIPEEEMEKLAAVLRNVADDKRIWDTALSKIDTDREADEAMVREFADNRKYYGEMIERRNMFARRAYVSKKLLEENWKVG
nr:hypothetical protein [Solobacterium sp.]